VPDFVSGVNAIAHISYPVRILPAEDYETNRQRSAARLERCDYVPEAPCDGAQAARPLSIDADASAAERLAAQWQKRKREALEAVSGALREDRLDGPDGADLAQLVHNVPVTAGMFGEGELSMHAGALERSLKSEEIAQRSALAEEFLQAA
jgi:hypothetical protein